MINSLKKFAEHWAERTTSAWNELIFMTQHSHQKSMNLCTSSENQKDLTWWLSESCLDESISESQNWIVLDL